MKIRLSPLSIGAGLSLALHIIVLVVFLYNRAPAGLVSVEVYEISLIKAFPKEQKLSRSRPLTEKLTAKAQEPDREHTNGKESIVSSAKIAVPKVNHGVAKYTDHLLSWLERYKTYPAAARRRGAEGDALLQIRIDRSGEVLSQKFERRSGSRILDRAVERMIKRANPFPPMPTSLAGRVFEFRVPVSFRLGR